MAFPQKIKFAREEKSFQIVLSSPLKERGFCPTPGCEIFVSNLSPTLNEYQLLDIFESCGEIFQLRLLVEPPGTGRNRGTAYVQYTNKNSAELALKNLEGKEIDGNVIHLEVSFNNCRIFVGGIPVSKTKDEVWRELGRRGITNIVDVIMYRSYNNRVENRGFVFLEFPSHEEAAYFRAKHNNLELFKCKLIVDWAIPTPQVDEKTIQEVKVLFLRNLDVVQNRDDLKRDLFQFIEPGKIEKVHKFKNYAFVHVSTREDAEILKDRLTEFYKNTHVEVCWSNPPSQYTSKEYRQKRLGQLSQKSPRGTPQRSRKNTGTSSTSEDSTCTVSTTASRSVQVVEPLQPDFSNLIHFDDAQPMYGEEEINEMARNDEELAQRVLEWRSMSFEEVQRFAFGGAAGPSSRPDELDTFDLSFLKDFM